MTTPLSEVLGSTKEETSASIKSVVGPTFKGITTKREWTFSPLENAAHRCIVCLDPATYVKSTDYDPYFFVYYCTPCRDKELNPKPKVEKREPKMIRYAGYNRRMPSITAETMELIQKAQAAGAKGNEAVIEENNPVTGINDRGTVS